MELTALAAQLGVHPLVEDLLVLVVVTVWVILVDLIMETTHLQATSDVLVEEVVDLTPIIINLVDLVDLVVVTMLVLLQVAK